MLRQLDGVAIGEQPISRIGALARVPTAFVVRSRLAISGEFDGGSFTFVERSVDRPYIKDYDAGEAGGPGLWPSRFDLSHWGLIAATVTSRWVGGAVIAAGDPAVDLLEGRSDLALLWDIRVAPAFRRMGVGGKLFSAVKAWCRARGCTELKVETQDINVAACRFYERQGCEVRRVEPRAYPGLDEVQLLWYRGLEDRRPSAGSSRSR